MFRWFKNKKEVIKIEPPVPELETEWVVLEKDRYIRQRLNSKVAVKNFSLIENIKEELRKMKSENEEILFNAEFGFDQVIPPSRSSLFSLEDENPISTRNMGYKQRYVSWTEENPVQNYKSTATNGGRNMERSVSMDNVFRMSISFSETASENPEDNPEDESSLFSFKPIRNRSVASEDYVEVSDDTDSTPTEDLWEGRRDRRKCFIKGSVV